VLLAMGMATTPDLALAATTLESGRTTPHRRTVQSLRDWWATKRQGQLF
jgi:hypothetical protein